MRTKLFGAFIAALAITAFAALPSAAMAQSNVTLKEGKLTVPVGTTVRATSSAAVGTTPTTFKGRPNGLTVGCATTSIRAKVRTNPGARLTFRNEGLFRNAEDGDQCKVTGPGIPEGRLEARVENLNFRQDITLDKKGTEVRGRTEARFTFRIFDRTISPTTPIAGCSYDGKFNVTSEVGSDKFKVKSEEDAKLEKEPVPPNFGNCEAEGFLEGEFRLTRRDGVTPVTNN